MAVISELRAGLDALESAVGDISADALLAAMRRLDGDAVVALMAHAASLARGVERVLAVGAGVIAERSSREAGHAGLAGSRGHKSPVALVQEIVGGTRAEASRVVRVGQSLGEGPDAVAGASGSDAGAPPPSPWHDVLRQAMFGGRLSGAKHDAILRGLGEPPERDHLGCDSVAAWRAAAEQLLGECASLNAEDLVRRARQMRDILDEEGLRLRVDKRYEARSFKFWRDRDDGTYKGFIHFDDEMGQWITAIEDAALRPRRGGPRFVDPDAQAQADELAADPRTPEQLRYDLMMDVLRAGALASASDVFGARQPGVRMVVVKDVIGPRDALGRLLGTGHVEDGGDAVPGTVIDRTLCSVGSRDVTTDRHGNPLDVGREHRLYTPSQRVALAVRDGGCLFPGCSVPASYCEAHHCDHWHADQGRTDIDRGILLCRHHHMLLHNNGWRITREERQEFILHPPGNAEPVPLRSRSPIRWAWDPPPTRPGWRVNAGAPAPGAGSGVTVTVPASGAGLDVTALMPGMGPGMNVPTPGTESGMNSADANDSVVILASYGG